MSEQTLYVIGQVLGYVAMTVFAISYQIKRNTPLIIVQTLGTVSLCLSYLFIGQTDAFAINILCVTRNICLCFIKPRTRLCYTVTGLLMIGMTVVSILAWKDALSLLIFLPLIANTFFLSLGNPQLLRKSVVVTSSAMLVYNVFAALPGAILSEAISVISSIVGIIRFRSGKKRVAEGGSATTQSEDV